MIRMIFIRVNGQLNSTTYITSNDRETVEEAKADAMIECCEDWGPEYTVNDLYILGVAEGEAKIVEWDDQED